MCPCEMSQIKEQHFRGGVKGTLGTVADGPCICRRQGEAGGYPQFLVLLGPGWVPALILSTIHPLEP